LADDSGLRFAGLNAFDKDMNGLDHVYHILLDPLIEQLALHEDTRQLIYRRGALVFVFNFHTADSYTDLRIPVPDATDYQVILNTDDLRYGGHGRAANGATYHLQSVPMYGRDQSVQIYLPSRSAQVLAPSSS
jgi:1,4-alpha-glucan branching enzyme